MGLNTGCTCLIRLCESLIISSVKDAERQTFPSVCCTAALKSHRGGAPPTRSTSFSRPSAGSKYPKYHYQIEHLPIFQMPIDAALILTAAMILSRIKASIRWEKATIYLCITLSFHMYPAHINLLLSDTHRI